MPDSRRILFASPPYHCGVVEVAGSWPPLGFQYLGAQARLAGWDAGIYDAMTLRHEFPEIEKRLKTERFDVFATSAITPTTPDAIELCVVAKRANPDCITLIGGVHPTFMPEEVLKDSEGAIDYIIAGEGEEALRTFLENFEDPAKRDAVENLIYLRDDELITNPRRPLTEDLDTLPAAWDLLDWSDYTYYVIPDSTLGAIATSRGCDHACTFCSQQRFWNKTWRACSPRHIVENMQKMHDLHGVNVFLFTDEYPTRDRDRWEELIDRVIAAKLDSYILMETRVEDIIRDADILHRYREAGVIHIYVGAEATDQETLDLINKEISVTQSRDAIALIAEHRMISETSFVLGFPDETQESIEKTFKLACEFNPDFAHFLTITPWPYADIYNDLKDQIEDFDYRNYNLIEPIVRPHAMSRSEVDYAIIDCYRRFYMPKMLTFAKVKDPFRREYLMKSSKLIMKSSFLIGKFAKLGINPAQAMQDMLRRQGATFRK